MKNKIMMVNKKETKREFKIAKPIEIPIQFKVLEKADSKHIYQAFTETQDDFNIPRDKSKFIGTDGASVLTGKDHGVVKQVIENDSQEDSKFGFNKDVVKINFKICHIKTRVWSLEKLVKSFWFKFDPKVCIKYKNH